MSNGEIRWIGATRKVSVPKPFMKKAAELLLNVDKGAAQRGFLWGEPTMRDSISLLFYSADDFKSLSTKCTLHDIANVYLWNHPPKGEYYTKHFSVPNKKRNNIGTSVVKDLRFRTSLLKQTPLVSASFYLFRVWTKIGGRMYFDYFLIDLCLFI